MAELRNPLQKLTPDEFCLILSHRRLGVSSEDQVIDSLAIWLGSPVKDFN